MTRTFVLLVALAALAATGTASASRTNTSAAPCTSSANRDIIAAVERRLNGAAWPGINICCDATRCTWGTRTGSTASGTVKAAAKPGTYSVTVPGHVCTATTNLQPGSAGSFRMRCVKG